MALSNTWTFTVIRDDIIHEAMLNVGALGEAETPTAQEVTDCARKLNMMAKQWMGSQDFAPGLKMWERQRGELFLTSAQSVYKLGPTSPDNWAGSTNGIPSYQFPYGQTSLIANNNAGDNSLFAAGVSQMSVGDSVGVFVGPDIFWTTITAVSPGSNNFQIPGPGLPAPVGAGAIIYNYSKKAQRPIDIVTVSLRDQYGEDIPLYRMTVQDYENLPTKVQPGYITDPSSYYYESHGVDTVNGGDLLFLDMYGAQDCNKHLHIVYIRPVMDFTLPTDNPEYPQQWYRPLAWGLAREIAPMFDAEWTQDMQANLDQALSIAREIDPETTSLYFQPNDCNLYGV